MIVKKSFLNQQLHCPDESAKDKRDPRIVYPFKISGTLPLSKAPSSSSMGHQIGLANTAAKSTLLCLSIRFQLSVNRCPMLIQPEIISRSLPPY